MGGSILFITGGARSGKSSYAERLAMKFSGRLRYVATAKRSDGEMDERIKRHEKLRRTYDERWETIETPLLKNLQNVRFSLEDVVLFDCLTVLMANELYHSRQKITSSSAEKRLQRKIKETLFNIAEQVKVLLIVSNELFYEGDKCNALVHQYQRMLGRLHEKIVKDATIALLIEAGEPVVMKGKASCKQKFIR